jgi:hypothetical protein
MGSSKPLAVPSIAGPMPGEGEASRRGADSARILSAQLCIHQPLSACIHACAGRGGDKAVTRGGRRRGERRLCSYCAAVMRRRSP